MKNHQNVSGPTAPATSEQPPSHEFDTRSPVCPTADQSCTTSDGGGLFTFKRNPPLVQQGDTAIELAVSTLLQGDPSGSVAPYSTVKYGVPRGCKARYFYWSGPVPGNGAGRSWVPALFRISDLPDLWNKVVRDHNYKSDDPIHTAQYLMGSCRTGLGADAVALITCAKVEIDHLSADEQLAKYTALANHTGINWSLMCWSGGKSVHAYIRYSKGISKTDPRFLRIQQLLSACLEGDTALINPDRVMRLPGWDGREGDNRIQHVMHVSAERYGVDEVLARLSAYAHDLGMVDYSAVTIANDCLRAAHRLEIEAKKQPDTALAAQGREVAGHLRTQRTNPRMAPVMLRVADELNHGAHSFGSTGTQVEAGRVLTSRAGHRLVEVEPSVLAAYKGFAHKTRVVAPCCVGSSTSKNGVVFVDQYGNISIYCHSGACNHLLVAKTYWVSDKRGGVCESHRANWPSDAELAVIEAGIHRVEKLSADPRIKPYADRVAARDSNADGVDPDVVSSATAVIEMAKSLETKKWANEKVQQSGWVWAKCGIGVSGYTKADGLQFGLTLPCKSSTCTSCVKTKLAMWAASITLMPPVEDGRVSGPCLGESLDVYESAVPLKAWRKFRERKLKGVLWASFCDGNEYRVLHAGWGVCAIRRRPYSANAPQVPVSDVAKRVKELIDWAIKLTTEFGSNKVEGSVSVCWKLTLDGERIAKMAKRSVRVVVDSKSKGAETVNSLLEAHSIPIDSKKVVEGEDGSSQIWMVTAEGHDDVDKMCAVWEAASKRPEALWPAHSTAQVQQQVARQQAISDALDDQ